MKRFWPETHDRRWIGYLPGFTAGLWIIIYGSRRLLLGSDTAQPLRMLGLAFAISLILCTPGFFGWRRWFLLGMAGLGAGLAAMGWYYLKGGGWEDLIGLIVLLELFVLGNLAGIGWELAAAIRNKLK